MKAKPKPYNRGRQIVETLVKYGPLSKEGLRLVMEPPIEGRRLRDALQRLNERGLLGKRIHEVYGGSNFFYQVPQRKWARERTARHFGINPDVLHQPYFAHVESRHLEACAIWLKYLSKKFPDARIYRKHEIAAEPGLLVRLGLTAEATKLLPDFVLLIKVIEGKDDALVAVDINFSGFSERFMQRRLIHLVRSPGIDAIICAADECDTISRFEHISKNKILPGQIRKKPMGPFSVLFCPCKIGGLPMLDAGITAGILAPKFGITLQDWIQLLQRVKSNAD